MKRNWRKGTGVLGLALAAAATCAAAAEVPAKATGAYQEAFGPPPKVEGGGCIAAVAFLPGAGASGSAERLGPLPLFSLEPDRVVEQAARVVVEGYPTPVRYFQPPRAFPQGSRFLGLEVQGRKATVRVSLPGTAPEPRGLQALAHTLSQFDGIEAVSLAVAGGASAGPSRPDPSLRELPPPPRFLDVVSSAHPGEEPEEIDVLFDRPLEVRSFSVRLGDGTGLPGRTYTSMYDMAVVHRPENPEVIREGLPLAVRWSVADRTGRAATGERTVELRIYRHPK